MSKFEKLKEWARGLSGHTDKGEEVPDPRPMAMPLDWEAPVPIAEEIRRLVAGEAARLVAQADGVETFEEAEDFDIPDDPVDPGTPWENDHVGKVWTREAEIRSGIVSEPDYLKAKEIVEKAKVAIAEYEAKKRGPGGTGADAGEPGKAKA